MRAPIVSFHHGDLGGLWDRIRGQVFQMTRPREYLAVIREFILRHLENPCIKRITGGSGNPAGLAMGVE